MSRHVLRIGKETGTPRWVEKENILASREKGAWRKGDYMGWQGPTLKSLKKQAEDAQANERGTRG